jgi:heme oxygenase
MLPLKEATAAKHALAEQASFNQRMFRGELGPQDYLLYLEQQRAVFEELERYPLPHPALSRIAGVEADIAEALAKGCSSGGVLPATRAYVDHLAGLSGEERGPHVYLNYLALMFGGQMMKQRVPSSGKMYDFDDVREAMAAVRAVQQDAWADEVNRGFDFHIALFDELQAATVVEKS